MVRLSKANSLAFSALLAAVLIAGCSKPKEAPPAAAAEPPPAPAAEPAPPPAPANTKEFMVGELTGVALRDGGMELPNDNKVLGVGHTPEEVAAVLSAAGQPTDKMALSIQPLLVKTPDRVLLFDTGAGANFGPGAGKLQASLAEAGVDPAKVTDIFISHVHGDHIGGLLDADGKLAFPNATIHLSKPEWKFLSGLDQKSADMYGVGKVEALVAAIKPKVDAFKPGDRVIPLVEAVDIKGHTPGHSGYKIHQGPDSILYIGDAMHHFVVSVAKPDWANQYDSDQKTAAASRADLIAKSAASGQRIYAVHFPFPGLGKFEKQGDGYAWKAE